MSRSFLMRRLIWCVIFVSGLTDDMRNDFSLMKDLAVHTRVDPKSRNKSLLSFMDDICKYA